MATSPFSKLAARKAELARTHAAPTFRTARGAAPDSVALASNVDADILVVPVLFAKKDNGGWASTLSDVVATIEECTPRVKSFVFCPSFAKVEATEALIDRIDSAFPAETREFTVHIRPTSPDNRSEIETTDHRGAARTYTEYRPTFHSLPYLEDAACSIVGRAVIEGLDSPTFHVVRFDSTQTEGTDAHLYGEALDQLTEYLAKFLA